MYVSAYTFLFNTRIAAVGMLTIQASNIRGENSFLLDIVVLVCVFS